MSVETRPAKSADRSAMADLWIQAAAIRRADAGLLPAEQVSSTRLRLADRMASPSCRALVACEGDRIVGMALGLLARQHDGAGPGYVPGLLHITMVAVRPDLWGRRVGPRIITELLDDARQDGLTAAQLWTHESNERAINMYERLGFTRSGRTKTDAYGELIAQWKRQLR